MNYKEQIDEGLEEPNSHKDVPIFKAIIRMSWYDQESLLQGGEDCYEKFVENFKKIVPFQLEWLYMNHVVHV